MADTDGQNLPDLNTSGQQRFDLGSFLSMNSDWLEARVQEYKKYPQPLPKSVKQVHQFTEKSWPRMRKQIAQTMVEDCLARRGGPPKGPRDLPVVKVYESFKLVKGGMRLVIFFDYSKEARPGH